MTSEIRLDNAGIEHLATPLKVSPIALGTWTIGGWMWRGTDETAARADCGPRWFAYRFARHGRDRSDPSGDSCWRRGSEIHGPTRSAGGLRPPKPASMERDMLGYVTLRMKDLG